MIAEKTEEDEELNIRCTTTFTPVDDTREVN
jgi:hypothetical protein